MYQDVDVVSAWVEEFEKDVSDIKSVRKLPEFHNAIQKFAKYRNPINHPVAAFRKKCSTICGELSPFPFI